MQEDYGIGGKLLATRDADAALTQRQADSLMARAKGEGGIPVVHYAAMPFIVYSAWRAGRAHLTLSCGHSMRAYGSQEAVDNLFSAQDGLDGSLPVPCRECGAGDLQ